MISIWVRVLRVPMHLSLTDGPFVSHNLISAQESPVPLRKFQMASKLRILMSSESKKGIQIYFPFLSKSPGRHNVILRCVRNTENFKTHYKISPYLATALTSIRRLQSMKFDAQTFLHPQLVTYTAYGTVSSASAFTSHTTRNCSFSLSLYLTENTVSLTHEDQSRRDVRNLRRSSCKVTITFARF